MKASVSLPACSADRLYLLAYLIPFQAHWTSTWNRRHPLNPGEPNSAIRNAAYAGTCETYLRKLTGGNFRGKEALMTIYVTVEEGLRARLERAFRVYAVRARRQR